MRDSSPISWFANNVYGTSPSLVTPRFVSERFVMSDDKKSMKEVFLKLSDHVSVCVLLVEPKTQPSLNVLFGLNFGGEKRQFFLSSVWLNRLFV